MLVFSADQLCSSDVGELTWVLRDWIMAGGINLIAGMPAAGKSFLALDLAIGIASSGIAWNNQPVIKGKVLYHFLDGSYRGMRSRVINLCKARCILPPADLIFDFSPLNLKATAEIISLRQRIKRLGVSVVIFDVMAKFIPGADENSVAEISPMMNTLREIANQTGTTFILIHHLNKGGNPNLSYRVRGSSDILGSVDTAIVVENEHQNVANSMRVITPQKVRESLPPKPLKFQIVSTDESISLQFADGDTEVTSKSLGQQQQIFLDLINYLESEPDQEFLKQDLVQTLQLPENTRTVGRAFAQLLCDPKVQVQKKGSFKSYKWKKDRPDQPYP
jgi:archaellum biogenesis ATPase FlaH